MAEALDKEAESKHSVALNRLRAEWAVAEAEPKIQEDDERLAWNLDSFHGRVKYLTSEACNHHPIDVAKGFTYSLSVFENKPVILSRIKMKIILPASIEQRHEIFSNLTRGINLLRVNVERWLDKKTSAREVVDLILELDKVKKRLLSFGNQIRTSGFWNSEITQDSSDLFLQNLEKSYSEDLQETVKKLVASQLLMDLSEVCDESERDLFLLIYTTMQEMILKETGRVTANFFSIYRHECKLWEDLWLKVHAPCVEDDRYECMVCDAKLGDEYAVFGGCGDSVCQRCLPHPSVRDCIRCQRPTKYYMMMSDVRRCLDTRNKYEKLYTWKGYCKLAGLPFDRAAPNCSDDDEDHETEVERLWRFYNLP